MSTADRAARLDCTMLVVLASWARGLPAPVDSVFRG